MMGRELTRLRHKIYDKAVEHIGYEHKLWTILVHVRRFPDALILEMLSVNPELRGMGLAGLALRLITEEAEKKQLPVFLHVVPQDSMTCEAQLRRLYSKAGFEQIVRPCRLPHLCTYNRGVDMVYWPRAVRLPKKYIRPAAPIEIFKPLAA